MDLTLNPSSSSPVYLVRVSENTRLQAASQTNDDLKFKDSLEVWQVSPNERIRIRDLADT